MLAEITTCSGSTIPLLALEPKHIKLSDIAHALSMLCRFNGHVSGFYSVAEHSVLVSRLVPPEHRRWALLHDAAEAYLGDIPGPLKTCLPEAQAIELRILRTIAVRFRLPDAIPAAVMAADKRMLEQEKRCLLRGFQPPLADVPRPRPLPPRQACGLLSRAFAEAGLFDI